EDQVRLGDVVGEAEDPWGWREQDARHEVDQQVRWQRDDPCDAQLIVRQQAVDDGAGAEDDWNPLFRTAIGEPEYPGSNDEKRPHEIIDDPVNPGRNNTHGTLLRSWKNPSGIVIHCPRRPDARFMPDR